MRFPAFQKLEEVAVIAEIPAIVAEPTEEVAIIEITPQPSEYEVLRANAIAEQERASQVKLQRVLDYTKQTMVTYMSEAELDRLCGYIIWATPLARYRPYRLILHSKAST